MVKVSNEFWQKVVGTGGHGVCYFARGSGGIRGGTVSTAQALERVIGNLSSLGYNVYININPAHLDRGEFKAKRAGIREWRHVLIDIDPIESGARPMRAAAVIRRAFLPRESITVLNTGRGVQMWLEIAKNDLVQPAEVERATSTFLRCMANEQHYGCRVDTKCSDLARIARVPGSVNQKTGIATTLIRTAKIPVDPSFVLRHQPAELTEPKVKIKSANLLAIWPHLTVTAEEFIFDGRAEPGRHNDAFASGANLAQLGVPIERAREIVLRGSRKCRPKLGFLDTSRAVENAYRRVNEDEERA